MLNRIFAALMTVLFLGAVAEAQTSSIRYDELDAAARAQDAARASPAAVVEDDDPEATDQTVGRTPVGYAPRRQGRRQQLSPEELQQLNALGARRSEEMLGARPANSKGYQGVQPGRQQVRPGCREQRVADEQTRLYHVRVVCGQR